MPAPTTPQPCLYCQECGRRECLVVFRVELDLDLLHTLLSLYPEWFEPSGGVEPAVTGQAAHQVPAQSVVAADLVPFSPEHIMQPVSPPHAQVDDSPLHNAIDKNKESLKVKLMLRRPRNQLVEQGIMPPLKSPPAYHEQRQKLERAKMGDLLKAKIQQRPDRQELIRQHILEADMDHVDPSLAEKQRQLKKCKLADQLNDQLSHRPGPLELIKKNILHTEEPIERAVKEGHIEFKATSEGQSTKPVPPDHYMLDEDSSSLSPPAREGSSPPESSPPPQQIQQVGSVAPGIVTVLLTPIALANGTSLYATAAPSPSSSSAASSSSPRPSPAPSSKSQRKKTKTKQPPKTRTIKFHEYKGPPNAQKSASSSSSSSSSSNATVETPYELLLQQQQLFLQWQLEWQHKYPQIILPAPATTATATTTIATGTNTTAAIMSQTPVPSPTSSVEPTSTASISNAVQPPPPPPLPQTPPPPPPPPPIRNLEDMKVSDLRAELKRRNLPVSGSKPQLIERLKPYSESVPSPINSSQGVATAGVATAATQVTPEEQGVVTAVAMTPNGDRMEDDPNLLQCQTPPDQESIIREQQRKIDQLQRQLQHQLQNQQNTFQVEHVERRNAKASLAAFLQQQQLNQALQQQQQQLQQQQQAIIINNNNINNNNNLGPTLNNKHIFAIDPSLILNHINIKESNQDEHQRAGALPNFVGTFVNGNIDLINTDPHTIDKSSVFDIKPEVIKQEAMDDVKSQTVDDILEILIRNGELPESASSLPLEGIDLSTGMLVGALDMDVDQDPLMDVDTDWLDTLVDDTTSGLGGGTLGGAARRGDPLLPQATASPVADLFMDDTELALSPVPPIEFSWDKVDFAT